MERAHSWPEHEAGVARSSPARGGRPHVRAFRYRPGAPGGVADTRVSFLADRATFWGGLFVAAGDLDGDGRAQIVTGAGEGGLPQVRVWRIAGTAAIPQARFLAYGAAFRGGVRVALPGTPAAPSSRPPPARVSACLIRTFDVRERMLATSFVAY